MRRIRNSKGYTLLLTLGIIVLFAILGASLVTLTSSGVAQNTKRNDTIHSLNLAEKSEQNFIQDFNTTIQTIIDNEQGIDRDEFIKVLNDFTDLNSNSSHTSYTTGYDISKYKCKYGSGGEIIGALYANVMNANDKSFSCIKSVSPVYNDDGTINDLKKSIVLYHNGYTNGKSSSYETTVEVGSNYVPEQLYYALTSKDNSDIHLNGAIEIAGDIKVGRALTISNHAYFNGDYWGISKYPLIRSTDLTKRPRIVISDSKNLYRVNHNSTQKNTTLYNNLSPTFSNNKQTNNNLINITDNFSDYIDLPGNLKEPSIVSNYTNEQEVVITGKDKDYKFQTSVKITPSSNNQVNTNEINNRVGTLVRRCVIYSCYNLVLKNGTYNINKLQTSDNHSLYINSSKTDDTSINISNSLYVDGNLVITGNVKLSGNIFVKGNIIIDDANIESNAMIYTYGTVKITDSKLNSLTTTKNGVTSYGTLLIFAKGSISLSNISQYLNTPSKIYGYFYSDQQLEIYGVGSYIEIHGGLYGNRVKLNAVRGHTTTSKINSEKQYFYEKGGLYIRKLEHLTTTCSNSFTPSNSCYNDHSQSRLKVFYDKNVIQTFKDLDATTQIIHKIDPPSITNKRIIQ